MWNEEIDFVLKIFGGIGGICGLFVSVYVVILGSRLDRKNYVRNKKFDMELSIYPKLNEKVFDLASSSLVLFSKLTQVPEENKFEFYSEVVAKYNVANKEINVSGAFIPKEIYNLFDNLRDQCWKQLTGFKNLCLPPASQSGGNQSSGYSDWFSECINRNDEIIIKQKEIINEVRKRLDSPDMYKQ